jgi:hypothetical protein
MVNLRPAWATYQDSVSKNKNKTEKTKQNKQTKKPTQRKRRADRNMNRRRGKL